MAGEVKKVIQLEIGHVLFIWAVSPRLIPTGERSGSPTHIATMESVTLLAQMKS
jgi:hypothetical protein